MSGHSKWSKIKRQKEVSDQKKSKEFGRLTREILVAARVEKDPENNAALRDIIARAKKANMPQTNIDRLLHSKDNVEIREVVYEGFGPGGAALLITVATDNPNRTVAELRALLKNHGGRLGDPGSAAWKFKEQFVARFQNVPAEKRDELELAMIDAGATDIISEENTIRVQVEPSGAAAIQNAGNELGLAPTEASVQYVPSQPATIASSDREILENLINALEEHQDVTTVTTDAA